MTHPFDLFDAHLHIVDRRFALVANQGFVPEPFTVEQYRQRMHGRRVGGGAVVSGSFQAFDQDYLVDALRRLGPSFVGVTQLPASASDAQLQALHLAGVRAVRFNLKRGGSEDAREIDRMARRLHELLGWHVELYADAADLANLVPTLTALPKVSIDHLGLTRRGLPTLRRLVEGGVRVKATGFGRVDFDVRGALRELVAIDPDAVMFGTDLPSTRAPRTYADDDVQLVVDAIGDALAAKVLCQNALVWYRPPATGAGS
jgi:predicted TIM-barrel fold metal-dependent hydrolase